MMKKHKIILAISVGITTTIAIITPIIFLIKKAKPYVLNANNYNGIHKFPDGYIYKAFDEDVSTAKLKKLNTNQFIDTNLDKNYTSASLDENFNSSDDYYSRASKDIYEIKENILINFYNKEAPKKSILNETQKIKNMINSGVVDNLDKEHIFAINKFYDEYIHPKTFKKISINTEIKNTTNQDINYINLNLDSNSQSQSSGESFKNVKPNVKKILKNRLDIFKDEKDLPTKIIGFNIRYENDASYTPIDIDGYKDYIYKIKLAKPLKKGEKINIKAKYLQRITNFGGNDVTKIFRNLFGITLPISNFYNRIDNKIYDDLLYFIPKITVSKLKTKHYVKFIYPHEFYIANRVSFTEKTTLNNNKKISYYSYDNPNSKSSFISLRNKKLIAGNYKEEGFVPIEYDLTKETKEHFEKNNIFKNTNLIIKDLGQKLGIDIKNHYENFRISNVINISGGYFFLGNIALNAKGQSLNNVWLHEYLHSIFGGLITSYERKNGITFFEESITQFLTFLYIFKLTNINYPIERSSRDIFFSYKSLGIREFWNSTYTEKKDTKTPILSSFKNNFITSAWSNYTFGPLMHLKFYDKYKNKYIEVIKDMVQIGKTGKHFNAYHFINSIGKRIGRDAQDRMLKLLMRPASEAFLDLP